MENNSNMYDNKDDFGTLTFLISILEGTTTSGEAGLTNVSTI